VQPAAVKDVPVWLAPRTESSQDPERVRDTVVITAA
jgi:hypothetical protein